MDVYTVEGRVRSFAKLNWPPLRDNRYTLMAMAGFYCRPLTGSPDNVCCFACSKNLDGWQPSDEAWAEHVGHGRSICFLVNLQEQENREESFRASKWPHTSPSAEQMAAAGFFYYPRLGGDDTAFCFQCGLALDGWEPSDDPMHEHSRRRPLCPYVHSRQYRSPAAFERILGSSSQPYVREVAEEKAPEVPKPIVESKHQVGNSTEASNKENSFSKPIAQKKEPKMARPTMDVQKRLEQIQKQQKEQEQAESAKREHERRSQFLQELVERESALFASPKDLNMTVEDFVRELVQRQFVSLSQ